jgi:hypothetical protein
MALRSVAALLALASFASARAQTSPPAAPEPRDCGIAALQICAEHVLQDETGIVTSPLHITPRDLFWVVPIAAGTAVALHYDPQAAADLAIPTARASFQSSPATPASMAPRRRPARDTLLEP